MRSVLLPLSLLAVAAACQPPKPEDKKSDASGEPVTETKTESVTNTESDTDTDTSTAVETANVAIDLTPNEVFVTMATALVSAAEVQNANGVTLNPGTVAVAALTEPTDPCKNSGGPNIPEGDPLQGTGRYAGIAAYCDLAKHPDGPDTTLGAIDRVQSLLCAIGANLKFDGKPYEFDLAVDAKCFSEAFVAMAQQEGFSTLKQLVTATKGVDAKVGSTAFDHFIRIEKAPGAEIGFDYFITLSQKDGVLAAAFRQDDEESSDVFSIYLDTKAKGSIRYEGRMSDVTGGTDVDVKVRHLRVVANGVYDKAKKGFSSIDALNYVFWDVYGGNGDKVLTVSGSPDAGYRAVHMSSSPAFELANYAAAGDKTFCYGGTCEGNAGILVAAEADFSFAKSLLFDDPSYLSGEAWFKKHGPLSFETVTLTGEQD